MSPKCRTDEGAAVYDLPVGATRCPMCGSKRLTRLFNAVNVGRGMAQHVDSLVEPEVTRQREALDAPLTAPAPGVPVQEQLQLGRTTSSGAGMGMVNLVPPEGRAHSSGVNVPLIRRLGGPMPRTGVVVR